MSDQPAKRQLEVGRIYLRDTRNGNVHDYQPLLEQMSYMARFVAGEADPNAGEAPKLVGELTGAERAAEFDRLASMTNEAREAEMARIAAERGTQAVADATPITPMQPADPAQEGVPEGYRMTAAAEGVPYGKFIEKQWTDDTLVEHKMMEKIEA